MRLRELAIDNFKGLRNVIIRPAGSLTQIIGLNGAGKSSVLEAIAAALCGKSATPPKPIREGAEVAVIRLDLGEMRVVREFKRGEDGDVTTRLSVTLSDGGKAAKPQATLDAVIGTLGFDPMKFLRLAPREQFEMLKPLVKGFDFDKYEREQKADYDARTDANRRANEAKTLATRIELPDGPKPEKVSVADLLAKIDEATKHNADIDARVRRRDEAALSIGEAWDVIETQQRQLAARIVAVEELQKKLDAAEELPAPIETAALRAQISGAENIAQTIAKFEARDLHAQTAKDAAAESVRLSKQMESREAEKREAISKAKMPVKGLDLSDGEVTLDDLPFAQSGMAKKLTVSMGIAMAMNPDLKLVLLDEGSELDDKSIDIVEAMAAKAGYVVMLTKVAHGGETGIYIEDGRVVTK